MADLAAGSTIAGFPIITEGNYKDYLYDNKDDPFITVGEAESKYICVFTDANPEYVKNGDLLLNNSNKTVQIRIGNNWSNLVLISGGGANPPGAIVIHSNDNPGNKYIFCDGREVSRSTYSNLYRQIGTRYGNGNGSSTFNVPDLRGAFIRGWDHGRGIDNGRSLGSYQADSFKSHNHTGEASSAGGHTHGIPNDFNQAPDSPNSNSSRWGGINSSYNEYTSYDGEHNHSFTSSSTGGDETRPRNVAFSFYITT